jgi:hypothetical protein
MSKRTRADTHPQVSARTQAFRARVVTSRPAVRDARQTPPDGYRLVGNVIACATSGTYLLSTRGGQTSGRNGSGVAPAHPTTRDAATDAAARHGYLLSAWHTRVFPTLAGESVSDAYLFARDWSLA